jgi:hypothetical protein
MVIHAGTLELPLRQAANKLNRSGRKPFGVSRAHLSASLKGLGFRKMKFTSLFLTMCGFALGPAALAQAQQAPNHTQQNVENSASTQKLFEERGTAVHDYLTKESVAIVAVR